MTSISYQSNWFILIFICLWICEVLGQDQQQPLVDVNEIVLPENLEVSRSSPHPTTYRPPIISITNKPENVKQIPVIKSRQISAKEKLVCPGNDTNVPLFTLPCERDQDCTILGTGLMCCERKDVRFKRCLKGVAIPKPEQPHSPWLRVFPRKCPESPIAEFREVKNCSTDADCTPRICCPERGTSESYCRTAAIQFDEYPMVKRMLQPVTSLVGYFQCTPPPPPVLDLFPKECRSAIDCFPNLCCQERGKRVCRPPMQSILSLLVGATRRIAQGSTQMTNNVINSIRN